MANDQYLLASTHRVPNGQEEHPMTGNVKWQLVLFALVPLFFSSPARGESLDEAWATAMAIDQRLQASENKVQAARWRYVAARAGYKPTVKGNANYALMTDSPNFSFGGMGFPIVNDHFAATSVMARQPLWTSGRISGSVQAAACQENAVAWDSERTALDLKLEVATAYVTVLRSQRAVEVISTRVTSLAAHEKVVDTMLQQGKVPTNDLLAARVSLADARQLEIRASNQLAVAKAAYNRLLGRPLNEEVELDDLEAGPASGELESLTAQALASRPELAALAAQANALRHQASSVRAATKPQLGVQGGYLFLESPTIDPNGIGLLMLGLEWTPYDGGAARSNSNALMHDARAISRLRTDTGSAIALQVQSAWLDEQETRKRIEVMQRAVEQADENLRAAKIRYGQGVAPNTEVLDAESLRTATLGNYYQAIYDAVLATYHLQRAVGSL